VFICVVVSPTRAADKEAEEGRVNGTGHMFNKNASTIVVTKGNLQWQVIYTSNTKWLYGTQAFNKPSSLDQLKEGWYLNCKRTFDGNKLVASACRFRESK
jgi:hypothetical protein